MWNNRDSNPGTGERQRAVNTVALYQSAIFCIRLVAIHALCVKNKINKKKQPGNVGGIFQAKALIEKYRIE